MVARNEISLGSSNITTMKKPWKNKIALITGASSGIGCSIAELFASKGIKVILVARNSAKLKDLVERIKTKGGNATFYSADLSIAETRVSLYKQITDEVGTPDIIINNAGIGWYGFFSEMPWKTANDLLQLNIIAPTHLTSLFINDMLKLERGRIINIGSIAGKLPEQGIALYSASKGYLDLFTKSLYRELRGTKLTVSILRAGAVKTNFFDSVAEKSNGRRIPSEGIAITSERVANKAWSLIECPRRFAYVPFYTSFSPLLESLFSWAIDLVGPVLLRRS